MSPTQSVIVMVPARCKLAYIRAGIIVILESNATGLVSAYIVSTYTAAENVSEKRYSQGLIPTPQD